MRDGEPVSDSAVARLMAINRICEGFQCTPRMAIAEVDLDPEQTALQILDIRAYLACKERLDTAKNIVTDLRDLDGSPYLTLVETHTFELRQERLAPREPDASS